MNSKKSIRIFIILDIVFMLLLCWFIYVNAPTEANVKATVKAAVANQKATQTVLESTLSTLQIANKQIEDENKEKSIKLSDALSKNARIKMEWMCPVRIVDVDFGNNDLVAAAIKAHLQEYFSDAVITNDWSLIYGVGQTAIHNFYWNDSQYTFVVYFNEGDFDTKNGIFDTLFQCWANLNNE